MVGGIWVAFARQEETIGGLGGAAAVILSYALLFVRDGRPGMAVSLLRLRPLRPGRYDPPNPASEPTFEELTSRVQALEANLTLTAKAVSQQNIWLAVAAVIGNSGWAIGQYLASVCIRAHSMNPLVLLHLR